MAKLLVSALLLALTIAVSSAVALATYSGDGFWGVERASPAATTLPDDCEDMVGECSLEEAKMARRELRRGHSFISYGAMKKNGIPCSQRGRSYYDCGSHKQANPYRRGCSAITRCARNTRSFDE